MTEKQINQLKKLLNESEVNHSSEQLDQKILKAAHDNIERQNHKESSVNNLGFKKLLALPLTVLKGTVRPAIIAVSVTLVIFIGMGQMLSFENEALLSLNPKLNVEKENVEQENVDTTRETESKKMMANQRIDKPQPYQLTQIPSEVLRDEALLSSIQLNGLPSTSELLASLDISLNLDRANAQHSIDLAMNDIRSMIEIGELNNARERYVQLKSIQLKPHCPPCRLPDSLDAFYIDQSNIDLSQKTG